MIQVVQCNYPLWGKVASGVAIWWRLTHTLHRYDYLYGPHWFPDDIMTCNFREQSPGDEAGCSFESHDFTSLALTLAILYPVTFPHPCILYLPPQRTSTNRGNFLEFFFFLKNPFFGSGSIPFLRASGTQTANSRQRGWVSTLVHTFTGSDCLLTRWEVFDVIQVVF